MSADDGKLNRYRGPPVVTAAPIPKMKRSLRFTLLLLVTLLIPLLPFAVIGELPGETWLSARDDNALTYGLVGAGLLACDVLLPIPSSIVISLLGARLGFVPGWLFAWSGLVVGNLVGYGLGRWLLGFLARDLPRAPTLLVLLVSRPVPVLAEAATFSAGAARVGWWPYLGVVLVGNAIYTLVLSANGAALLPDEFIGPGLALPLGLPVLAWLGWRWLVRRGRRPAD